MKQFGLQQIVPPHFIKPFPRNEIIPLGDNKCEKLCAIYFVVWNKRMDPMTYGEDGDAGPHTTRTLNGIEALLGFVLVVLLLKTTST